MNVELVGPPRFSFTLCNCDLIKAVNEPMVDAIETLGFVFYLENTCTGHARQWCAAGLQQSEYAHYRSHGESINIHVPMD